jgi:hypothetical protein
MLVSKHINPVGIAINEMRRRVNYKIYKNFPWILGFQEKRRGNCICTIFSNHFNFNHAEQNQPNDNGNENPYLDLEKF